MQKDKRFSAEIWKKGLYWKSGNEEKILEPRKRKMHLIDSLVISGGLL